MRENVEQPDQEDEPGKRCDAARVCGAPDRPEYLKGDGRTGQGKDQGCQQNGRRHPVELPVLAV